MKHKVLVVTGGIGSGKTSLLNIFQSHGFSVYNADEYSRNIYKGKILADLENYFPEAVKSGQVDRSKLREIISCNEEKRLILNALTHKEIMRRLAADVKSSPSIIEIPLYSEVIELTKEYFEVIGVIYIDADYDVRIKRISQRDNISSEKADMNIKSQIYDNKNKELSSTILYNNKDLSALEAQLDPVFEVLNESF